jgi:hypothetical protein
MSEPTAPVAAEPVESSAPETTESIVEAAAADLQAEESGSTSGESTSGTTTTTTSSTTTPTEPITQAEKDELAEALGITGDGTTKWTTRVNYSKVHKAVKALREKQEAAHAAALKTHSEENTRYKSQVERFDSMVQNPDQLLRALASVNPQYAAYVKGAAPQQPQGTPQRIETMEDLQRVIDQQVAQRLKPIEQERAAAQFEAQAIPKIKAQLAEAQTWPLFKEHQAEIQKAVAALPQNLPPEVVLRQAYQSVVLPKLAANRDTVRSEVMAELKNRPHASTVTTTVSGRGVQSPEAVDTEDIVRQALASIK